jgi:CBS domain-containing protein
MKTRLDTILNDKGRQVFAVHPDATTIEAVWLMNRNKIGAVLVLDDTRLVGIFTERDILTRVVEGGRDATTTPVKEVMTTDVVTMQAHRTVEEGLAVMSGRRCRHLPVFEDRELIGLVSIGDLIRWLIHDKSFLIDQLYNFVTDQYPA